VKKVILLIIFFIASITIFTSCGLEYRHALNDSLHNQIEGVWLKDVPSHIIYQDKTYQYVGGDDFFRIGDHWLYEDDVMLSWNGYRYIGYIDEYYSDSLDNPLFIYEERTHNVYFREDYNYLADTFIVEDSDIDIVFEDMFSSKQENVLFTEPIVFTLKSKTNSRIKVMAKMKYINNQYYISFYGSDDIWMAKDVFVGDLRQAGII